MQEIARAAGVAQSLLHHHFGTKDQLWDAVAQAELARFATPQRELLTRLSAPSPAAARQAFFAYFEFLRANPDMRRLFARMSLEGRRALDLPEADALEGASRAAIEQAQKVGIVRADVHPQFILLAFRALVHAWFVERVVPADLADRGEAELDQLWVESAWKMFEAAVSPG